MGMNHNKITNGVRKSKEKGHSVKWAGVLHEYVVNTAMNRLCCQIYLFWRQFMNKVVL